MIKKPMTYQKTATLLFAFIAFFTLLLSFRYLWIQWQGPLQTYTAKEGIIQLSSEELRQGKIVQLNGDWEFYPQQLLTREDFQEQGDQTTSQSQAVPQKWDVAADDQLEKGTYRLQIAFDEAFHEPSALRLIKIHSAFQLFVDGELLSKSGQLGAEDEAFEIGLKPVYAHFPVTQATIEIILQVTNDTSYRQNGGVFKGISFGPADAIAQAQLREVILQWVVVAIFLSYLVYTLILYSVGMRGKSIFTFAMALIFTALSISIDNERILLSALPLHGDWAFRWIHVFYLGAVLALIQFVRSLFPQHFNVKPLRIFMVLGLVYTLSLLILPMGWVGATRPIFNFFFIASPLVTMILIAIVAFQQETGAFFLLFAATAVASSTIGEFFPVFSVSSFGYYPFDMLAAIIALSAYWFQRYFHTTQARADLSEKLQIEMNRKDDFLANTSHELRNPLHGILNIAQVVLNEEQGRLQEKNLHNLKLLISIGNHMTFVVNDLLDLTKLKERNLPLHHQKVDVESVIRTVYDMMQFSIQGKHLHMTMEIEDDLPLILADENRVLQILFNLVHNAVKFTQEGKIIIGAYTREEQLVLYVEDTGIGIDAELLPKIFDRYEQQDGSITSLGGGVGIGLAICQELVTLHGGTIEAHSTKGAGSRFTVTLPIAGNADAREPVQAIFTEDNSFHHDFGIDIHPPLSNDLAAAKSAATIRQETRRILLVDDDAINLQTLSQLLLSEGYEVHTALSGQEALNKLEDALYHLVITDLMMPKMSGYELVQSIRKTYAPTDLPILVLTARDRREDMLVAFHAGANDYAMKPVDAIELTSRVQVLVSLQQSIEERVRFEAAWLQAQINPHFFFNVLNSIIILSEIDEERMHELMNAFSDFLRASFDFNNTEPEVPIAYELDLVRAYLTIEQIRFGDRIEVVWDIDESLSFKLPPLSIQTLIENALKHGILSKPDGGRVTISIQQVEEEVRVTIQDDGVGFEGNPLVDVQEGKRRGVGLPNTNFRLKQLYGQGLQLESQVNVGTVVSFKIPLMTHAMQFN